ncbi:class I SAM-dependent methyltransferase [Streptomyces sp. NPDC092369]|uniref:class I SAM-dependent methyltransferase n=1 Tax=Streptomyces sp. NPDC092369 TaxID=3366015 RepID=UPI00382BF03E
MSKTAEMQQTTDTRRERYDILGSGANDALFAGAGVKLADRVLDVGCGTGVTTRIAARIAVRGHVVGVDTEAPLLRRARERTGAEKLRNASYMQVDAEIHPFPRAGFDVIVSGGAVMFFTDPVAGFGNLWRTLLPGGRLAFVCPRSLWDPDRIREILRSYENIAVRPVPVATVWGGDTTDPDGVRPPGDVWLVTAKRPR